ncbi:hypothetical protein GC163_00895 [bacterium]|nr:hypothetical protein [bacterium]
MNAWTVCERILWKDYRVLRQMWWLCGVGAMAVMLLILAVAEFNEYMQGYSEAFWLLSIWIPPIYILAALAAMFAGEREEGTLVWLTALSPRLSLILGSRMLLLLVSGLVLQVWFVGAASILSRFDTNYTSEFREDLTIMTFVLVEAVFFGMFWSLQTSRPLNAILYAAITMVVVNAGAVALTEAVGQPFSIRAQNPATRLFGYWGWFRCMLLIGVATANWSLAEQWLNGRPWDWEWLSDMFLKLRLPRRSTVDAAEPVTRNELADPWRRAWLRLRWLEWQSLRTWCAIIGVMSFISAISLLFSRRPEPGFCFGFGWLLVALGGVSCWHGEQAKSNFRALVRLGVSPAALWLNKLLAWALMIVVGLTTMVSATFLMAAFLKLVLLDPRFDHWNAYSFDRLLMLPFHELLWGVLSGVSLYCLAFTASHLCRKTVIAIGVTLLGWLVLMIWFVFCYELHFPLWMCQLPIPIWLLWISWSALPVWWIEQSDWRISRGRLAEIMTQCVFPFVLIGLTMGYRVWEVPTVPGAVIAAEMSRIPSLKADHDSDAKRILQQWLDIMATMQRPIVDPSFVVADAKSNAEPPPSGESPPAADALGAIQDAAGLEEMGAMGGMTMGMADAQPNDAATLARIRREYVELNFDQLVTLRNQLLNADRLSVEVILSRGRRNPLYGPLLLYAAQESLRTGDVEVSIQYLQAGIRLGGCLQRFIPLEQQLTQQRELRPEELMDEMIRWAQMPQQTELTLRRGLEICAHELPYWQVQPEEIEWQEELDADLSQYVKWYMPWERVRTRRLAGVKFANRLWYFEQCQTEGQRPGQMGLKEMMLRVSAMALTNPSDPRVRAWQYMPVEENHRMANSFGSPSSQVYGLDGQTIEILHRMENRYRATVLVMAIVGYRRLTGELPGSIYEVARYLPQPVGRSRGAPGLLTDVWSGAPFHYEPKGFPLHEPNFPPDSIYRHPFLWSGGQNGELLRAEGNAIRRESTGFTRPKYGYDSNISWDQVYPIPPQDPVVEPAAE